MIHRTASDVASPAIQVNTARRTDSTTCATGMPLFISRISGGSNDPVASLKQQPSQTMHAEARFKQEPHQTAHAKALVRHEAHRDLPAQFMKAQLSAEGNKIRTLIGIIYNDVQKSGNSRDIETLEKVINDLSSARGNEEKEQEVAQKLSGLVSKYSTNACYEMVNQYIEHCMDAWDIFHQDKSVDVKDKVIFTESFDSCKENLREIVKGLSEKDQPWEVMAQKLNQFVDGCTAISKTLTFHGAEPVTPTPNGPEPLNAQPADGANTQRLFIPTPSGQEGITLNISNDAKMGNMTQSVGAAAVPADANATIAKHIIESPEIKYVDKLDLLKHIINANAVGASDFLSNLVGVQGFKQEQSAVTEQMKVVKRETAPQTDSVGTQSIATQTGNVDDITGAPELPKSEPPTKPGVEKRNVISDTKGSAESLDQQENTLVFDKNQTVIHTQQDEKQNRLTAEYAEKLIEKTEDEGSPVATQPQQSLQEDSLRGSEVNMRPSKYNPLYTSGHRFDPLNHRNVPQQKYLRTEPGVDKQVVNRVTDGSRGQKDDIEMTHAEPLTMVNRQSQFNIRDDSDRSLTRKVSSTVPVADSALERLGGEAVQENSGQVKHKSVIGGFQPAQLNVSTSAQKSAGDRVYTTVPSVSLWNREHNPANLMASVAESAKDELGKKLDNFKTRDRSVYDNLEKKKVEQKTELLPFQKKLAEYKSKWQ